jgi:GT2 family glycosyltransferase
MTLPDTLSASILIASYQRPATLQQCLASLLVQTRLPDEVVVVTKVYDPASAQAVESFRAEHALPWPLQSVQVVETSIVAAENAGLAAASGDVVCFLDDDAVARPDWLARLLAHYTDESVGAVGGRDVLYIDGTLHTAGQPGRVGELTWYGRMYGNHHLGADGVRDVYFLKGVNMSARRGLVPEIDPRLRGDVTYHWEDDLCLAMRAQGYRVLYDPLALVDHYAGRGMGARDLESPQVLFDNNHNVVYVLLKYVPLWQKLVALAYTLGLGDGNTWGLLGAVRQVILGRRPPTFLRVLSPSLAGKMAGVWSYVRSGGTQRGSRTNGLRASGRESRQKP